MSSEGYKQAWVRPSNLDTLNQRIHDAVPIEELADRADDRRDTFFERFFPYAQPAEGARVLELGQGVGWIMESMLAAYPIEQIVGVDVSPVMIESAQERWSDPRASYVLYDGLHIPLEDDSFDNVYSVACLQHVEKHHAFLAMKELVRLLKPGGHGTLHLMSVHHIPTAGRTYEQECWNHVNNADEHWMHYYSLDEIIVLFSDALGVTDLDVKYHGTAFWVHFSKGTERRFHAEELEQEYFLNRQREDDPNSYVRRPRGQLTVADDEHVPPRTSGSVGRVLVTGASRGIGLELVRQYAATGYDVIATCRDPETANDLRGLAAGNPGITVKKLDVSSAADLEQLLETTAGIPIDILVCNAGVFGGVRSRLNDVDFQAWSDALDVNALGSIRVALRLWPNVAASTERKIVFVSSRAGLPREATPDRSYIYTSSKAALNSAARFLALDLASEGIITALVNPGFVQTAIGGMNAPMTPTESVKHMRFVINNLTTEDAGKFLHYDGTELKL